MKSQAILAAGLALCCLDISPLAAQQIEFPQRSTEQRLLRASQLNVSSWVGAIAYAKSVGQTAEELGTFLGELYAPSWSGCEGQGPACLMRGFYRNFTSFQGSVMEVMSESGTSITARCNRPWIASYFGDDHQAYGVTVEEYERVFELVDKGIADYLGLSYEQEVEGDWIVFTVSQEE